MGSDQRPHTAPSILDVVCVVLVMLHYALLHAVLFCYVVSCPIVIFSFRLHSKHVVMFYRVVLQYAVLLYFSVYYVRLCSIYVPLCYVLAVIL